MSLSETTKYGCLFLLIIIVFFIGMQVCKNTNIREKLTPLPPYCLCGTQIWNVDAGVDSTSHRIDKNITDKATCDTTSGPGWGCRWVSA